jgi:hypothetical protein
MKKFLAGMDVQDLSLASRDKNDIKMKVDQKRFNY